MVQKCRVLCVALAVASAITFSLWTPSAMAQMPSPSASTPNKGFTLSPPLTIKEEGTIAAGAQELKNPGADGGESHYDYLQANYQIPAGAHSNALIMWHGCLGAAWERRPDGAGPGFMSLMVQKKWPVFVIDQPRISRGQRGTGAYGPFPAITLGSDLGDCASFATFRYGTWNPPAPKQFFPGVQLAQDPESVSELCELSGSSGGPGIPFSNVDPLSQTTPPSNVPVVAVSDLITKKAGNGGGVVIVDHSNGGQYGLLTAIANNKVKGIVSFEGATFVFPSSAPPAPIQTNDPEVAAINAPTLVSDANFAALTRIPIIYYFGDNIDFTTPSTVFGVELWRVVTQRVAQFCQVVNSRGGDCQVVYFPKIGIFGNTHFDFSDLNNVQIAGVVDQWLKSKNLDK